MKKSVLLLLLSLLIPVAATSQGNTKHLLFKSYVLGKVYFKDGTVNTGVLNYSLLTGKMLFMRDGTTYEIAKPNDVDHIDISEMIFVPAGDVFYQVIREGENGLYYQYFARLIPAGKPGLYGTSSHVSGSVPLSEIDVVAKKLYVPDEYNVNVENRYFVLKDGTYRAFTRIKDAEELFPGKEKALKDFLKKTKNKFKTHQEHLDALDFLLGNK